MITLREERRGPRNRPCPRYAGERSEVFGS